jgi:hypothetical protein
VLDRLGSKFMSLVAYVARPAFLLVCGCGSDPVGVVVVSWATSGSTSSTPTTAPSLEMTVRSCIRQAAASESSADRTRVLAWLCRRSACDFVRGLALQAFEWVPPLWGRIEWHWFLEEPDTPRSL